MAAGTFGQYNTIRFGIHKIHMPKLPLSVNILNENDHIKDFIVSI